MSMAIVKVAISERLWQANENEVSGSIPVSGENTDLMNRSVPESIEIPREIRINPLITERKRFDFISSNLIHRCEFIFQLS
jgi:hypothetical protein